MAHVLKYELLCTSKKGNAYKLKLLFDGYEGDDIDRDIPGESPFVLRKDKAAVIRGTSLDFAMREEVNFELDEFYTNNAKKIKAELYKDTTLLWSGYNLPQQYQAPYIPAPVSIRFTATDGLGLLKNEKFGMTGLNSQLATIIYCVDKIGLGLGYSIAINLFEVTHDHTRTPLAQTYEEASIFNDLDCYSVIEKILNKYDAEITQANAKWHITRSTDKLSTRMLYSPAGVYETTEAAPEVLELGYPDIEGTDVWPVGQLTRGFEPGGKQVSIEHDFGRKASFLDNYEFWRYTLSTFAFESWSQNGTFTASQQIMAGKAYAYLSGVSNNQEHKITQAVPITNVAGEDFVFEVDFAPVGRTSASGIGGIIPISMEVRMTVYITDGTTIYYLSKEGWTTTPGNIKETVKASLMSPVFNHLKIITDELPCSGTLVVELYRFYLSGSPRAGDSYGGIAFSEPLIYFLKNGELYPSGLKTTAIFDNSSEPGDIGTIKVLAADAPDYVNARILYRNITRLISGLPTTIWHILGSSLNYSILVQMARTMASNNRIAREKLTGKIKGSGIAFNSIIRHTEHDNREFEISEAQWDLRDESYQVTLLELLAWSAEDITFTSESANESSGSGSAGGGIVTGVVLGNDTKNSILEYFELVNPGEEDEYLRVKTSLAADGEVMAYASFDGFPPSIFESIPHASASEYGVVKVGNGLSVVAGFLVATGSVGFDEAANYSPSGTWAFTSAPTVGGVAVSLAGHTHDDRYFTESETTTAISDAIANLVGSVPATLNTLQELGDALGDDPNFATTVSTALGNRMQTSHAANGITSTNITNWNSAFGWGNHASAGYALLASPAFTGTITLPGIETNNTITAGSGDDASYANQNFVINGWHGLGMYNPTSGGLAYQTTGYYDFRNGYWDTLAYPRVNGTAINSTFAPIASPAFTGSGSWDSPTFYVDATYHRVGINTLAPAFNLEVRSDGTGSWQSKMGLSNSTADKTVFLGQYGGIAGVFAHSFALDAWADLYLNTVTGTDGMVIKSAGNVGIGTTAPVKKLQVNGDIFLHGGVGVYFGESTTYADSSASIREIWGAADDHGLAFYTGYGTASERMRIVASNGNVLIGQTTGSEKLCVTGNVSVTGNLTASGEITAFSDSRIKTNITDTTSVLDRFEKLRVVDYTRTDNDSGKVRTGLIAQELRELFPQYVLGDEDKGMLSVNYAEMVSICIKAIQELKEEIKQLKN